jgi:tight adherence protein B
MSLSGLGLVIFLFSLLIIELSFYAYRQIQYPDRAQIRKRLRRAVSEEHFDEGGPLIKRRLMSDIPFINRMLPHLPGMTRLDLLIEQANLRYTVAFFVFASIALAFFAYWLVSNLTVNPFLSVVTTLISGSLPFLYIHGKKKSRMAKFERQLADGLMLIARALRAGHAFTSGMKFAADEFEDPLGPEFEETIDEINFGVSVSDGLKNLAHRVDCPDLSFFVVSVILQRETGGNLAEIIENIAHLIRERFRFRGKVRTLSAEGRFSAALLMGIPFVLFGILFVINRQYVMPLINDYIGRVLVGIAGVMMALGILTIRRIIKIEP